MVLPISYQSIKLSGNFCHLSSSKNVMSVRRQERCIKIKYLCKENVEIFFAKESLKEETYFLLQVGQRVVLFRIDWKTAGDCFVSFVNGTVEIPSTFSNTCFLFTKREFSVWSKLEVTAISDSFRETNATSYQKGGHSLFSWICGAIRVISHYGNLWCWLNFDLLLNWDSYTCIATHCDRHTVKSDYTETHTHIHEEKDLSGGKRICWM